MTSILSTSISVRGRRYRVPPSLSTRYVEGEAWGEVRIQELVKRWRLFGRLTVWVKVLDSETVPPHVWLAWATLGDCAGWHSRFTSYPADRKWVA